MVWVGKHDAPEPIQCSTSTTKHVRLALEPFRGEPAISRFVRHFTNYSQVIPSFCNTNEFGPPRRVTVASPCP